MNQMNDPYRVIFKNIITHIVRHGIVAEDQDALCLNIESICRVWNGSKRQLMEILSSKPTIFRLCYDDSMVELIVPTKLCPDFCSVSNCNNRNCSMFHICKFYALSDSCLVKSNSCKFGHDFEDGGHNQRLIFKWMLDYLDFKDLRVLFCLTWNRTSAAIPVICEFYNKHQGCKKGNNCTCLHICKHYVWGTCTFKRRCIRSHDIEDIKNTLKRYGINIAQTPRNILNTLKYLYENLDDAPSRGISDDNRFASMPSLLHSPSGRDPPMHFVNFPPGKERASRQGRPSNASHPSRPRASSIHHGNRRIDDDFLNPTTTLNQRTLLPKYTNQDSRGYFLYNPLDHNNYSSSDYEDDGDDDDNRLKQQRSKHRHRTMSDRSEDEGRKRRTTSGKVCSFYLQGKCRFGEKCHNMHVQNARSSSESSRGFSSKSKGSVENICLYHLRGRCLYGQKCHNEHKNKTFQWQRKDDQGTWVDFSEDLNEKIEKKYCSLEEEYFYSLRSMKIYKIDFADLNKSDEEIRRLSTIAYSSNSNFVDRPWTTKWLWYWKSENGWIQYGRPDNAGFRVEVTSQKIEDKFSNSHDMKFEFLSSHSLLPEGHSYILDFTKMIQKNQNMKYGTERKVLRRPEFVDEKVIEERKKQVELLKKASELKKPETWEMPVDTDIFSHFQIVKVETVSQEYQDVKRDFEQSNTDGSKVTSVRRVENGELWRAFNESKDALKRKLKREIEPMRLFHGTSGDLVQAIARQGFDCRLAGSKVGHLYGKGGYFGKTSSVSARYCDMENKMFVAKVLVGDVTRGSKEMPRPPPKNPAEPHGELYDTTVDDPNDPKIFVKFDNNHMYPEYVITFK